MRRIVLLATLDTKGEEAAFVADCITQRGNVPWLVDLSLSGDTPMWADTSRDVVAKAAGREWRDLASGARTDAMEAMARGAATIVRELVERGQAQAVMCIGGGTGSWLGNAVMRDLPLGFPKLLVSTLGAHDAHRDIVVMPAVADVAGLNRVLKPILANAAAAVCGMAEGIEIPVDELRPTIALTMFGVTTAGATLVRRFLEEGGCEAVVFHANGNGGATMEELARQGMFAGILDWTTSEVTDEIAGGVCTAGPTRLDAAAELGIPQVIVPGAIDVINIRGEIPERFAGRTFHMHLPAVALIRTNVAESREIGAWIGRKLNRATAPVRVLIPERGYSTLDAPDGPFHNEEANNAFVDALKAELRSDIPVELLPNHIHDEAFARAAADAMLAMVLTPAQTR